MRTPLARLRAAAEVEAMNGHGGALPETVMEETTGLLDMINTALAVSQTENIADTTPREEIDLSVFVGRMADLYSAPAEDVGIDFSVDLPTLPVFVFAHKAKLQQLVGNLLDNALKFTPRGGRVMVSVKGDPVELAVTNTGPGIEAADIPHVFSRFWRAQKSRSLPGNGLGLALVKAIAQTYGASVTCVSSSSGPTTFSVRWQPNR